MLFRSRARLAAFFAATAILAGLLPSSAKAYDEDVHFYGTYAIARYAGINHEVASRIATTAEWMDESNLSDPTSYIFLPVTGIKKRRLLHFPSSRVIGAFASQTQQNILGISNVSGIEQAFGRRLVSFYGYTGTIDVVNFMTETTEDNPFASELFMQGLKEGNLMKAAASLHVLEDSFAHAGTPAEQGHAIFWHWPDRPFAAPDKYFRMVDKVFLAMVAIRQELPPEALDCNLHLAPLPDSRPNCEMDAKTLSGNFSATDAVRKTYTADTLRDPEYVLTAMRDFLQRAVKSNYVHITSSEIDQILASLPKDGKLDGYAMAEVVMKDLILKQSQTDRTIVDFKFVLTDMGRVRADASSQDIKDYIDSLGGDAAALEQDSQQGVTNLVHVMAEQLLKWQVPQPLSDHHRMEFEDDSSPIRKKEMDLRIRNARRMIRQLYGTDIEFVTSNSKDSVGLYHEVMMNPVAEPSLPVRTSTYYATFSLREKHLFDVMVFEYLFPDLKESDLYTLMKQGGKATAEMENFTHHKAEAKRIAADTSLNFFQRYWANLQNDRQLSANTSEQGVELLWTAYRKLRTLAPKFLSDLVNKHLTPSSDNFYYRNARLFDQYRKQGIVKPFFTPNDVWKLQDLKAEANAQSTSRSK